MITIVLSSLLLSCSTADTGQPKAAQIRESVGTTNESTDRNLQVADYVILPAAFAVTNWGYIAESAPTWDPKTSDVVDALQRLPDYLKDSKSDLSIRESYSRKLSGLRERLPGTVCQAVGVTFQGGQAIFLNCLPARHTASRNWRTKFVRVYDGGPRWWSVVYVPEERKFARLKIDLGF